MASRRSRVRTPPAPPFPLRRAFRFFANPVHFCVAPRYVNTRIPIINKEMVAPSIRGKSCHQLGREWRGINLRVGTADQNRFAIRKEWVRGIGGIDRPKTQTRYSKRRFLVSIPLRRGLFHRPHPEIHMEFRDPCYVAQVERKNLGVVTTIRK